MLVKRDLKDYHFTYPVDMDGLLDICVSKNGSDLHLVAGAKPYIRVISKLIPLDFPVLSASDIQILIYSILEPYQVQQFETELELNFAYSIPMLALFRGNLMVQRGSLAVVFRPIPYVVPEFNTLGLPESVNDITNLQKGLVIVAGASGSGKSTTVAAMINKINQERSENIITLEDPIEFMHRHEKSIVNQREIGTDTFSFSTGMVNALKHDPNIIFLGEMRDAESIRLAMLAAETGHLVFTTMHTQTSVQTITRLIDMFDGAQREQIRKQLASSLKAIISQQLLTKKDNKSRVLAVEILTDTLSVKNMIREEKEHQLVRIMQSGEEFGMQTMDQSLAKLYHQGVVTEQMVMNHCVDSYEMEKLINKEN